MFRWKRYVVGPDENGKSATLMTEATNVQENPGVFYRATLWGTDEVPVDNDITGDRAEKITTREPAYGGMLCRALEIPPDKEDTEAHKQALRELNLRVSQKHVPTEEEMARHPSMHRTDTLDCITCVTGEIWCVTDVDEFKMLPGDTVIIRGTNHAWSNRSDKPALLVGSMISALPG